MANCANCRLTISARSKDLLDMLLADIAGAGPFDFNRLIPMPAEVCKLSDRVQAAWSSKHWGTEWNAAFVEITRSDDTHCTIEFETKNNPPLPVLDMLAASYGQAEFLLEDSWDGDLEWLRSTLWRYGSRGAPTVARRDLHPRPPLRLVKRSEHTQD